MDTKDRLNTPDEWCKILGVFIIDPDGWRMDGADWKTPISRAEFERRLNYSTTTSFPST